MKIHREGYWTLLIVLVILILINASISLFTDISTTGLYISCGLSLPIFIYFLQFFRSPARVIDATANDLLAPADGSLVVVEETREGEYFEDNRLQVSIFMSPYNVHSNRSPVSGEITYIKYHPGKFLVAWHPKSSILNEKSTIIIKCDNGTEIMLRQIAGAVARRIVTYPKVGDRVERGEEIGFIKFGSRVDIFLPPGTAINQKLGSKVISGETKLSSNFHQ